MPDWLLALLIALSVMAVGAVAAGVLWRIFFAPPVPPVIRPSPGTINP